MAGLLGHLSNQDKELIEAGVHPVIDSKYQIKTSKKKEIKKMSNPFDPNRICFRCKYLFTKRMECRKNPPTTVWNNFKFTRV
jgi:hypothetical protein